MIQPAPGKKYDDFQLSYALDLLHGKMTVASATGKPTTAGPQQSDPASTEKAPVPAPFSLASTDAASQRKR